MLDRAEAYKTLRLDQAADGQMIETAYWTLVRHARASARQKPEAADEIERLNEAYQTLAPGKAPYAPPPPGAAQVPAGFAFLDGVVDWLSEEALRTRARWPQRNPELALIGGGALTLAVIAIGAGASLIATFIALLVVFGAIWAPWRKPL